MRAFFEDLGLIFTLPYVILREIVRGLGKDADQIH